MRMILQRDRGAIIGADRDGCSRRAQTAADDGESDTTCGERCAGPVVRDGRHSVAEGSSIRSLPAQLHQNRNRSVPAGRECAAKQSAKIFVTCTVTTTGRAEPWPAGSVQTT